jgi:hypothetical protein
MWCVVVGWDGVCCVVLCCVVLCCDVLFYYVYCVVLYYRAVLCCVELRVIRPDYI